MCYSGYMTENMVEEKETPMWRNSGYRLWKWLLGSIAALKEATVAIPEDATGTYGKQSSKTNPTKRNYEVVAVIPVELFTPNNRMDFRKYLKEGYKRNDTSPISDHIKDFSTYEYEIYVPKNKKSETCKAIFNKISDHSWNIDVEIMVALPNAPGSRKDNQEADMYINTGATIVIVILVEPEEGKNYDEKENLEKFLKKLGDLINNGVNNCNSKKMEKIHSNMNKNSEDCEENWLIENIYIEFFRKFYNEIDKSRNIDMSKSKSISRDKEKGQKENGNDNEDKLSNEDSILRLHNKIEVNYVFTFFICKGFDFYIIPQVNQTDDSIKYSGDAWFLETNKIYKHYKKDIYISEYAYNNLCNYEKIKYALQKNHSWLIKELIPEAEIRPKDLYYIPKINGGGYNDYSSILLRHINRLCCFIKGKYVESEEADDKNRIIGMQIIINSFWHRMVEFSRIMRAMCLSNPKKIQREDELGKKKGWAKRDQKKSKENSETHKMYKMDSGVESDFENQIHTTPTLAEQIIDVNSTDQDALTLSDLANYHSISSAKDYFNEQKEIYFRLRAEKKQMERDDSANKADRKIQVAVLILALITIPIGIIEIVTADISWWPRGFTIGLIGSLLLAGVIYFIEPINNFFSKLFRKNDKSDNSKVK